MSAGIPRAPRNLETPAAKTPPGPSLTAAPYSTGEAKIVPAMISAKMASIISTNITPPPTGRASSSFSNCRAVPELETMLCQPEIDPQAMVTNRIGQSGPIPMEKPV